MKQIVTRAIVLGRTDFGEADRILTLLTPDYGKLRLMAKGVRRLKSKMAGGIELFSVSDITFIEGRGEVGTLISTRLVKHYGHIAENIDRTMLGYELIKRLNYATEDQPETVYFDLLEGAFATLDESAARDVLIKVWFDAQLLRLAGHTPNLTHEVAGARLVPENAYEFSFDDSAFRADANGNFTAADIKFLRLVFGSTSPAALAKIKDVSTLAERATPLVNFMRQQYIR